jgi:hypothetical protein
MGKVGGVSVLRHKLLTGCCLRRFHFTQLRVPNSWG